MEAEVVQLLADQGGQSIDVIRPDPTRMRLLRNRQKRDVCREFAKHSATGLGIIVTQISPEYPVPTFVIRNSRNQHTILIGARPYEELAGVLDREK